MCCGRWPKRAPPRTRSRLSLAGLSCRSQRGRRSSKSASGRTAARAGLGKGANCAGRSKPSAATPSVATAATALAVTTAESTTSVAPSLWAACHRPYAASVQRGDQETSWSLWLAYRIRYPTSEQPKGKDSERDGAKHKDQQKRQSCSSWVQGRRHVLGRLLWRHCSRSLRGTLFPRHFRQLLVLQHHLPGNPRRAGSRRLASVVAQVAPEKCCARSAQFGRLPCIISPSSARCLRIQMLSGECSGARATSAAKFA
jgi:hypothetical protein